MQKQQRLVGILIVIIVAIGIAITNGQNSNVDSTGRTETFQAPVTIETTRPRTAPPASSRPRTSASQAASTARQQTDGFATIAYDDLPREAKQTIDLIQQGGPFPYEKDGSVFRNREELLPRRSNGYYREYTVETPGSDDRGARRIVAGDDGEMYYTDDHYDSFRRIQ